MQLLEEPGLNKQRRRPPEEVATEQQARDLDIPEAANVQRAPAPAEVHRKVQDEAMAERMRQYEVGLSAKLSKS